MQDATAQSSKPSLQGKLRLKRSKSDSSQGTSGLDAKTGLKNEAQQGQNCSGNDQSCQKENFTSNLETNEEEDSLADFKSPKREMVRKPIPNKYRIEAEKAKGKTLRHKTRPKTARKSLTNQPSIESSLFKPQVSNQNEPDLKEAVPCPVCLKPFKDDATCTNHMKSCAAKNKVSIKQLLEAKRLQDRQAQERRAIGLLAGPSLPEKKKAFKSKNFSTGDDPQLQLVLAMSESLYEAEKMKELEEAAYLVGIPSECIKEMNDEERKKTLQSFGFTTNKPAVDAPVIRSRKKKPFGPTILQTRSKQDKDRVLTERIACILTGDDALTQVPEETAIISERRTCKVINSKLLKRLEQTENKLWNQARLTRQSNNYYVHALKPHLVQQQSQALEPGPAHDLLVQHGDRDQENSDTLDLYEPMELDMNVGEMEEPAGNRNALNMKGHDFELEFMKNLSNNWKDILNDSSASDIVIFVKNNKHIFAHKLVFHTQCSNILLDQEPLDAATTWPHIQRKISWLDKEQDSALAFLEFIYSGTICKYAHIFNQKELVQQVKQLARLYKEHNLFTYIRKKQQELSFDKEDSEQQQLENACDVQDKSNINNNQLALEDNNIVEDISSEIQVTSQDSALHLDESYNDLVQRRTVLSKKLLTAADRQHSIDRRMTGSPDLFDSEEDESNIMKIKVEENLDLENDALGTDNINEGIDDTQNSDESEHLCSQKTLVNLSRSVSPLENLHEAVTPPSGRSPERRDHALDENSISNEQEIAQAVTPKCQSPIAIVAAPDVKQEMVASDQDDMCNAVTPEHDATAELNDTITPKKLVYADVNMAPQDHIDESIYTAVTPPRRLSAEEPLQTRDENPPKIKSELTMFIEKVQRRNAKDIMDTDSETDTPDNRARHKNPFSKRNQDDSYSRHLGNTRNKEHHKAISLLEKDVLNDEKEKNCLEEIQIDGDDDSIKIETNYVRSENENTNEDTCLSDLNEVEDVTVYDETADISMYSKYKKSTKGNNSIALYREKLNLNAHKISSTDDSIAGKGSRASNSTKTSSRSSTASQDLTINKPKPRIIEDITLVSDSDEEGKSPLSSFLKDKGKRKSWRSSPVTTDVNEEGIKINAPMQLDNIDHDKSPFESTHEPLKSSKNPKVFSSTALKNKSRTEVIDLSAEAHEDGTRSNATCPNESVVSQDASFDKQKSFSKQSSINKLIELEIAERKSEDLDAEISKILQSSQENMGDNAEHDPEKISQDEDLVVRDLDTEYKLGIPSPISIASSPEFGELAQQSHSQKLKDRANSISHNNYSLNNTDGLAFRENGDLVLFNDDCDIKTPPRMQTFESFKSFEGACKKRSPTKKDETDDNLPMNNVELFSTEHDLLGSSSLFKDGQKSALISSPILSQNRRGVLRGSHEKSYKKTSGFKNKESRSPDSNPEDAKKLKIKSASMSTLTQKIRETSRPNLQRSSSFVTPEQNKKPAQSRQDVTPPINYSLLETPDLHKELRKFGLKPQTRTKAKALLTHIYKETHSQPSQKRTSSSNSSSDEDGPPTKRQYTGRATRQLDANYKHDSKAEKSCVIAEEMDFDDPDVANIFQNPVSIKDAFLKLIKTNRELYTKVLTYDPLPLEYLHTILKQSGFKCKINCLMDVLDEQCITFQVKTSKGDRTKKKKK